MAIRLPLTTILDFNQTTENGAGVAGVNASIVGGQALPFLLPQDTDNVVVKFAASIAGGGASAVFQTSDDGGTTWYDVCRTSIISNANSTIAEFMSIPTISEGVRSFPSVVATGSIFTITKTPGNVAASSLGIGEVSGMPIIGRNGRVFVRYTAAITSIISMRVTVSANNQSSSTP